MLKIIEYLLHGCWHKWEIHDEKPYRYTGDFEEGNCTKYILRCEKCGKMKTYYGK